MATKRLASIETLSSVTVAKSTSAYVAPAIVKEQTLAASH